MTPYFRSVYRSLCASAIGGRQINPRSRNSSKKRIAIGGRDTRFDTRIFGQPYHSANQPSSERLVDSQGHNLGAQPNLDSASALSFKKTLCQYRNLLVVSYSKLWRYSSSIRCKFEDDPNEACQFWISPVLSAIVKTSPH